MELSQSDFSERLCTVDCLAPVWFNYDVLLVGLLFLNKTVSASSASFVLFYFSSLSEFFVTPLISIRFTIRRMQQLLASLFPINVNIAHMVSQHHQSAVIQSPWMFNGFHIIGK